MTNIEERLDLIIELLVLLVNQMERQSRQDSIASQLVLDNEGTPVGYSTLFRPIHETLAEVSRAFEAVKQDSTKQQEPQRRS